MTILSYEYDAEEEKLEYLCTAPGNEILCLNILKAELRRQSTLITTRSKAMVGTWILLTDIWPQLALENWDTNELLNFGFYL